jgi:hypothetical protein
MANKKRKKAAKKKHAAKRTANERKTTTANENAETEAVEKWLWILDKPVAIKGRRVKRRARK